MRSDHLSILAESPAGLEVRLTNYGATLTSVRAPDRRGKKEEITLGFDSLDGYLGVHPYLGLHSTPSPGSLRCPSLR